MADQARTERAAPVVPAPQVTDTAPPLGQTASEFVLADIERSRDYRKEYYKYAIGIATSLLAFTLAFQPALKSAPQGTWMEIVGWSGLGVAIASALRVHMTWANFFISFRDYDNKGDACGGGRVRRRLTVERQILDTLIILGLLVGVAGVVGFTAANLHNVAPKTGSG